MVKNATDCASGQKYVYVNIKDTVNGITKKYGFPEGTEFRTTDYMFKLLNSGIKKYDLIYEEGNWRETPVYNCTLPDKTINVILPQMIALGVFDVNKDKKIDSYDAKNIELEEGSYGDGHNGEAWPVTEKINSNLERANSSYCVYDPAHCTTGVSIDRTGLFSATFVKKDAPYPVTESKTLDIHLPEYVEELEQHDVECKKYIEEQKREENRLKEEKEQDKRYAEKHWFKYYVLGITRQEYEEKNERDY